MASGAAGAPPLVLLHGSGSNAAVWIRDVLEWARRYRVYAVDIIGEPGLSAPSRPPLQSNAYAEWLDDVWDALGISSGSVVGVSLGGWVALDYAVKRPSRVASLSLLSPAGIGARTHMFIVKTAIMLLFGKRGVSAALASASGKSGVAAPVAQYVTLIFENFRPRREAPPIFSDRELAAVSVPMQVVVGAEDAMLHAAQTRDRVRRLVPHAEVTFLEDAGHMLPPQTARVTAFLESVRGDGSAAMTGSGARTPTSL